MELLERLLRTEGRSVEVDLFIAAFDGIGTRATLELDRFPPERQLAVVGALLA